MVINSNIKDIFFLSNSVEDINESDYAKVDLIIETIKAFVRTTYQHVYIIDYHRRNFVYVSNNIEKLCGADAQKIKNPGYRLYIDNVPLEDLKMLLEINNYGFKLFETFPIEERTRYTISYDFHINKDNRRRLINHKLTPLVLTESGKLWLALCTISLASGTTSGNVIMKKAGAPVFYEYCFRSHKWLENQEISLSDSEREVLSLSAQGYTMNDIADYLYKSVDTIKAYKRNIFQKMKVKNIVEALTYAQNHQLI